MNSVHLFLLPGLIISWVTLGTLANLSVTCLPICNGNNNNIIYMLRLMRELRGNITGQSTRPTDAGICCSRTDSSLFLAQSASPSPKAPPDPRLLAHLSFFSGPSSGVGVRPPLSPSVHHQWCWRNIFHFLSYLGSEGGGSGVHPAAGPPAQPAPRTLSRKGPLLRPWGAQFERVQRGKDRSNGEVRREMGKGGGPVQTSEVGWGERAPQESIPAGGWEL